MDLNYAIIDVDGEKILNHAKITQQDSFEIIKKNSLDIIKESSEINFSNECYFSQNFDVIKLLLNKKNVYASSEKIFNHFKEDVFVGKFSTSSFKNADMDGIVKDVNKFLSRGLSVYIHSYYMMKIDKYIDDELTIEETWYWYCLGLK